MERSRPFLETLNISVRVILVLLLCSRLLVECHVFRKYCSSNLTTGIHLSVSILIYETQLTGVIYESFCKRYKENLVTVILDCQDGIVRECTCCDSFICFEELPEDVQDLLST